MTDSDAVATITKRVFLALDCATVDDALQLCDRLRGRCTAVKVGMELYLSAGPMIVHRLHERGYDIFLDVKLHDIPTTVFRTARSLARLPISLINVHALGGSAMMRAAMEGLSEGATQQPPQLLAVTLLTSTSESVLHDELALDGSIEHHVVRLAKLAHTAGVHGVVCAAHEVSAIKRACGDAFRALTPGIRLPGEGGTHDQARVATPKQAFAQGSDWIVLGRAITHASDPVSAWQTAIASLGVQS